MQTFLPYPDFAMSAKVLDMRRLGKQRVETMQLLLALNGDEKNERWLKHPAAKMWRGYEHALALYGIAIIREWVKRGYVNNITLHEYCKGPVKLPPWLGNEEFHASHRSQLLAKDPDWYSQFEWTEKPDMPYVWPVTE